MLRKFLEFEIREHTIRTGDYSTFDTLYYWDADPDTTDTIHPDDVKLFASEVAANLDHDGQDDGVEYEFRITLWQETTECDKLGHYSRDREELDSEKWTESDLASLLD